MPSTIRVLSVFAILACVGSAAAKTVEEVIQENLAAWRFRPGAEVYAVPADCRKLALTASETGALYLAWTGGGEGEQHVAVASSADGTTWQVELRRPLAAAHDFGPVALAAQGTGEALLAYLVDGVVYTVRRSAEGNWGEAEVLPRGPAQVEGLALVARPADGGYALATSAGRFGQGLQDRIFFWTADTDWTEGRPVTLPFPRWQALLGCRPDGALVTAAPAGLLRLLPEADAPPAPPAALPWSGELPAGALWVAPTGPAAAVVLSSSPAWTSPRLTTSADLQTWSPPAFLGWSASGSGRQTSGAVAAAGDSFYLATDWQPFALPWGKPVREMPPSPTIRVYRVDDSLTRDTDSDGWTDLLEEFYLTDPHNPDTDGDGVPDAQDLDPLAADAPDTDEAAIRQAALVTLGEANRGTALRVLGPRQAYTGHEGVILSLTDEESQVYGDKYDPWVLPTFWVKDIKLADDGLSATASWAIVTGSLAATGGTCKFEKKEGQWTVTDRGMQWIS